MPMAANTKIIASERVREDEATNRKLPEVSSKWQLTVNITGITGNTRSYRDDGYET
jgi:hypothetical protein